MLNRQAPLVDVSGAQVGIQREKRTADAICKLLRDGCLSHRWKYILSEHVGGHRFGWIIHDGLNDGDTRRSNCEQLIEGIFRWIITTPTDPDDCSRQETRLPGYPNARCEVVQINLVNLRTDRSQCGVLHCAGLGVKCMRVHSVPSNGVGWRAHIPCQAEVEGQVWQNSPSVL